MEAIIISQEFNRVVWAARLAGCDGPRPRLSFTSTDHMEHQVHGGERRFLRNTLRSHWETCFTPPNLLLVWNTVHHLTDSDWSGGVDYISKQLYY